MSTQENRHVVDVQGDSWALEHPVSCRQAGSLLDCPVHRWWMDTFDAPPAPPGRYQVFEVGGGYELAKRPLPRARIQSHVSATAVPGVLEERARLQQRIDWLFDTLLINHLDCGFDVYVREPVPGWFLDELAARWARREGGSVDEYRHALEMHGWQEEAPSE